MKKSISAISTLSPHVASATTLSHIKLKSSIHQRLIESGEKERLKAHLRQKLIESGWKDDIKTYCKEYIKKNGENLTIEQLIQHVTPEAKNKVPGPVKQDLVKRIRKFLVPQSTPTSPILHH
ncbi:enhance of yellow 2 like protein [Cavenderia fasciculata]|uniref:Transcription and mRNA export factor ENY2 n=1 Tax=Cavenderia fasciculata TaxID=261658 RepID=F4Q3C9_CACFS|nr:enhance of yellow 2 like protein [Cavenderia fasciculata]EGG17639.1 enhance of yellow 2 like protein [Cavenderia fasciculata]|eukprot:XP_004356123.1 enhance of yellow 2 like protein [Cavenderia fasciculata]